MRPILWDVDADARPPEMTVCFPGKPCWLIRVPLRSAVKTRDEALVAAVRQLDQDTATAWRTEVAPGRDSGNEALSRLGPQSS